MATEREKELERELEKLEEEIEELMMRERNNHSERELVETIKGEVRGTDSPTAWHPAMRREEEIGLAEICVILRHRICGSCFQGILLGAFSSMLRLDATSLHNTMYEDVWFEDKIEMARVKDGSCEIH